MTNKIHSLCAAEEMVSNCFETLKEQRYLLHVALKFGRILEPDVALLVATELDKTGVTLLFSADRSCMTELSTTGARFSIELSMELLKTLDGTQDLWQMVEDQVDLRKDLLSMIQNTMERIKQ